MNGGSRIVARVKANRNFDQMNAGDELVVELNDEYWQNQIKAGNIEVVEDSAHDEVEDFPTIDQEYLEPFTEDIHDIEFPEQDPED